MPKLVKRSRTQIQIDQNQDVVNERQDLVNVYQTTALVMYGIMLAGMFVLVLLGYVKA